MTNPTEDQSELVGELRQLTQNLKAAMQAAWASPGRRQIQADLQEGLEDMRQTFNQLASDFSQSEAGQKLKSDLEDLGDRVKSGELETQARFDLVRLLKRVNQELEAASERLSNPKDETGDGEAAGGSAGA
jgi:sulfite reductase alpha subunit-like flavoprotein